MLETVVAQLADHVEALARRNVPWKVKVKASRVNSCPRAMGTRKEGHAQSRRSLISVKHHGLMSAPRAIMMPSTPLASTLFQ